ncbi:MAG TPA: hypothetical protein VM942_10995 [Acidimicrobiales bacterium]|nr:hypothetical protein [Acidimicrobiales bacterium]
MRRLMCLGVVLALALALATAGCGRSSGADARVASATGSVGGAEAEDADTKEADREQAGLDFARCMREHGVDMPDPESGEGGFIKVGPIAAAGDSVDGAPMTAGKELPEEFAEAHEACHHLLDDLIQDGGPPMDAEAQDKALEFARCMREHGVDMPDPDFSGGGGLRVEIGIGGIDPESETFQSAQEACGSLFGPKGGPGEVRAGVAVGGGPS